MELQLHEAASVGDQDTLSVLLKLGKFDVNQKDPEWQNRTALHWACAKGYVECMRILLDHGADGISQMDMMWTPAHCAAESGKVTSLRALYSADIPVDIKDKYGDTPRRIAEIYGHQECIEFLTIIENDNSIRKRQHDKMESNEKNEKNVESHKEVKKNLVNEAKSAKYKKKGGRRK